MLMAESQRTIGQLLERLPEIDYLVVSAMLLRSFHQEETVEGQEQKLVLMYYARFKFIRELTLLLSMAIPTTTKESGGKVYIVGGAGLGKKIDYGDLGFKTKGCGFWKIRGQFPVYLDVILQEFAARKSSMTFIHAYPGPVRSALADNLQFPLFLFIFRIVFEFSFPFTFPESGEYMMHAMLTMARWPGAWSIDMFGEKMSEGKVVVATEDQRKMLWEHSVEETSVLNL